MNNKSFDFYTYIERKHNFILFCHLSCKLFYLLDIYKKLNLKTFSN